MFLGESTYKVDEKGRVPLPPKFRDDLQKGLVLVRWVDPCLRIYPLSEWEKVKSKISALPGTAKNRDYKRFIFSKAYEIKMDGMGRVAIPPLLRQYAEIGDTVVIIGQDIYAEMWSPEKWQAESESLEGQAWQITEIIESEHPG